MIVRPSPRLLRSFTVKGVILWVRITPLTTPIPSQKIDITVNAKALLLKIDATQRVAKMISALYRNTMGSVTINLRPPKAPAVLNRPSVSMIRFRTIAKIPPNTKLFL